MKAILDEFIKFQNFMNMPTVVDWNSLPYDILSSDKQATFKSKLHKHLRE